MKDGVSMKKTNLKDLSLPEFEAALAEVSPGEPKFRAKQIYGWVYDNVSDFDEMTNVPKALRKRLKETFVIDTMSLCRRFVSNIDGTRRYLFKLNDGNFIESVLMKYKHGYSLCVSSQVGCAMGCKFCASTKGGKVRDLSSGEIADQVLMAERDLGSRISNIVIMGIGEPLDNFQNVTAFIKNAGAPEGLGIGQRHITLSTCGIVPKIYELADMKLQITPAVSLHGADDRDRDRLMPINRKYNLEKLIPACGYYIEKTGRRMTFEYTLIKGVSDGPERAKKLAGLLKGMLCHVNLIPVNTIGETGFAPSEPAEIRKFSEILESRGIPATVRREMGRDISAACGQLRSTYNAYRNGGIAN